jgi:large subunit ribosomal protein L13
MATQQGLINVPGATKHFNRDSADRRWLLIDAKGHSVGRLATVIAGLLRGKHKPSFTRHDDAGDFVVVINASGLELRGNDKDNKKLYYKHTGYFGHLKRRTGRELLDTKPELVLHNAVWGMISGGALKYRAMKKLKIYAGAEHPHKAQNPQPFAVSTGKRS